MIDEKLTALGMHVKIDAAGNLIATRDGKNNQLPPIAFGSHVDCVPNGGHYDSGQIGVLGAIEIIETLVENDFQTNHPLELIVFSNEESGVFGSRALAGALTEASLKVMTPSMKKNKVGLPMRKGLKDWVAMPKKYFLSLENLVAYKLFSCWPF